MKRKIYIVMYETEDSHLTGSIYYFTSKEEAKKYAEEFIKDSKIFIKYNIEELCPRN